MKGTGAPDSPPIISVDGDGIITVHTAAAVWPYDRHGTTAAQVDTSYGYVLVTVQRWDRPDQGVQQQPRAMKSRRRK